MPKPGTKRVTLFDVASASGVSYQTVSRVINNAPNVAPATRERILRIIKQLGYKPNKAARSLAGRYSHTLALITYGMEYYGPAQMVIHIERAAKAAGYDLIFSNVEHLDGDLSTTIDSLHRWSVDGIIVITPVAGADHEQLLKIAGDVPLVQIDTSPNIAVPSVIIDQYQGSALATQHLIDLGHSAICEIMGPANWFGAQSRHRAWLDTLQKAELQPVAYLEGDWTARSGYEATKQLFERHQFTALVMGNDQMALGAMRAIQERGLRIPQDISIVGFDDIPEAAYLSPPLTTIYQDFSKLGQTGIEYLMEWIDDGTCARGQLVIEPDLIERASTAVPHR